MQERDPYTRLLVGVAGGAVAVLLFPKITKFALRTAAGIAIQAVPIVVAGLLAEKAVEASQDAA